MTTKTTVTTICDGPHRTEAVAVFTRDITVDGTPYRADLCPRCGDEVDALVASILKYARAVVPPRPAARQRKPQGVRTQQDRRDAAEARAAWKLHPEWSDTPWKDRGRMPKEVIKQWAQTV